ncbi:MAG: hypothetical protein Q8O75_00685 [bacterium]|nr:hypothetical protein [bacterium]
MLTKRQKISISSLILATGLFLLPEFNDTIRPLFIVAIIIASYFLSVWAIYGAFSPFELVSLFALPVILTASFGLYISQFAVTTGVRLSLVIIYIGLMYTILLSQNIFTVSVERNIPLVRAARTVGYLASLFVSFAFFSLIFGLGLPNLVFSFVAGTVSVLLFAQGLWQIELKGTNPVHLTYFSLLGGLILGEVSWALSFWPLDPPKVGLALAAAFYVVLGILQRHTLDNLNTRVTIEYLFVAIAVVIILIITTSWGI